MSLMKREGPSSVSGVIVCGQIMKMGKHYTIIVRVVRHLSECRCTAPVHRMQLLSKRNQYRLYQQIEPVVKPSDKFIPDGQSFTNNRLFETFWSAHTEKMSMLPARRRDSGLRPGTTPRYRSRLPKALNPPKHRSRKAVYPVLCRSPAERRSATGNLVDGTKISELRLVPPLRRNAAALRTRF
jgi:hypothetical protein